MISHSNAYVRLKEQQQELINFAILVSQSVPSLKKAIKGQELGIKNYEKLPDADYFKGVNIVDLKIYAREYKSNLSKHLILSSYSYFEFYFKDVIAEMIDFHGGKEVFMNENYKYMLAKINYSNTAIKTSKLKLNEYQKPGKKQKYSKHINLLKKEPNFRFPSEFLSTYGIKYIVENVLGAKFISAIIPDVATYALHMDLSEKINRHKDLKEKKLDETFEYIREIRNRIAHGNNIRLGFEKTMDLIRFLRHFALKIDNHLVKHFFINQKVL